MFLKAASFMTTPHCLTFYCITVSAKPFSLNNGNVENETLISIVLQCCVSEYWVPNLMILSHTGSFLIFLWLIFIFDNFYALVLRNLEQRNCSNSFINWLLVFNNS